MDINYHLFPSFPMSLPPTATGYIVSFDDDNEEEQHFLPSLAYAQTGLDASRISAKFITNASGTMR